MATGLSRQRDEIIHKHDELGGLVAKSVQLVWEIGEILTQVKDRLDHGQFLPWVEQNLPFSERTSRHYMAVFEHYPVGLPEGMDLKRAYIEAGVKKLAAPASEDEPARNVGPVVIPARDWAKEWIRLSKSPTLSGEQLKSYRVMVNPTERVVYALRAGHREPIPMAAVLMTPQSGSEKAWEEFNKFLHIATEHFLSQLEPLEEAGVIRAPEDHSVLGKSQKAKSKIRSGGPDVHQ